MLWTAYAARGGRRLTASINKLAAHSNSES
jgi:hypothetical protein